MLRSERRSKKTKGSRKREETPWHPRGEILIPPHKVEESKKAYNRKKEKFDWRDLANGKYDQ